MKILRVLAGSLFLVPGACGPMIPPNTDVQAKYVVEHRNDFRQMLQRFSVLSKDNAVRINGSEPNLGSTSFTHAAIYITNEGGLKLVLLDGGDPPKVIAERMLR